ncbi:MAG: prepilin peptidase [Candidatus Pacebacteria bacterium]|nr:prepilin peptidase [Candidatus Paceibacterota bacterium]
MNALFVIFSGILGALIGSFLNVVALRHNTEKGLGGRSRCFSCGHTLAWYELIPFVSWLIQKGRCRHCSSRISPMYFLGEGLGFLFFALVAARGLWQGFSFFETGYLLGTLVLFVLAAFFVVIFLYDIRHKIIPDTFSFAFVVLAFVSLFFFSFQSGVFVYSGIHLPAFVDILGGIVVPLPFFLVWLFSKGKFLGLGDVKLMMGIGFLFGIARGFSVIALSFWIGAVFLLFFYVRQFLDSSLLRETKKGIMQKEIPFAPFLIAGSLLGILFHFNFFPF